MRPIRLTLEGLRSYRERSEISFEKLGLFAITGQTGSGKSSILEALVFALYGASTFDARNAKALISDRADSLTVSLSFDVAKERYQVTRTLPRGPKGAVHELRGPGQKLLAATKNEVDASIERLLGLNLDDFLKTVVLPQGAFQQLLHSTPGDRAPLLKNLLGLDRLDQVAGQLAQHRSRLQEAVLPLRGRLRDVPEDLGARQIALAELLEQTLAEEATSKAIVLEWREGEQLRQQLTQQEREATLQQERLSQLTWPAESRFAELQELRARLDLQAEEQRQSRAQLDGQRTALQARAQAEPYLLPGKLENWRSDLLRVQEWQTRLQELQVDVDREQAALLEEQQALQQAAARQKQWEDQLVEVEGGGKQLAERTRALQEKLTSLQKHATRLESLQHDARRLRETSRVQQEQLQKLQDEHLQAGEEAARAREQASVAETRLRQLEQDSQAAALSHGHEPGDACPVCRRDLPADWEPPTGEGLDDARKQRDALTALWREQDRALTVLGTQVCHGRQTLETLAAQLYQLDEQQALLEKELQAQDSAACQAELALAEGERDAFRERYAALQGELKASRQASLERDKACQKLTGRLTDLGTKSDALREQREQLQERLLLGSACPNLAILESNLDPWEQQREAWLSDQGRLQAELEGFQQAELRLQSERQERFQQPWQELHSRLQANAQLAGLAYVDSDYGGVHLRVQCQQLSLSLTARLEEIQRALTELRAKLPEQGADLEGRYQQIVERRSLTQAQLEMLRQQAALAERIGAVLGPGEASLRNLDLLHDLLGNRARKGRTSFTQWLLSKRQQELLALASRIFGDVTGGQYAFSGEFQILDRHSGQERKPNTLSGGETFLASLSLALALSELVGRRGGRLEAFFLDEGFGTLSPECLDRALSALEGLAQSGRLIGIISHVVLLAERIENVWVVRKTPLGSRIEILSEELRQKLLSQDLAAYDPEKHPLLN